MLIINADDWGRSTIATDNAAKAFKHRRINSTSFMVFMGDSERGARLVLDAGIDAGLHLNFSEAFTAPTVPEGLRQAQRQLARFLRAGRYALIFYHPFLRRQFWLVLKAQMDEFGRFFGRAPSRLDGHQHMHLASNILIDHLLPEGTKVRRSFSFAAGEKGSLNRTYRRLVDQSLARRHRITDYFFALSQNLTTERLRRVVELARSSEVELMTHPESPREFARLMSEDYLRVIEAASLPTYNSV